MIEDGGGIRASFVSNCDLRERRSAAKLPVEMEDWGGGPTSITAAVRRRRFRESCSCGSPGNLSHPLTIQLGASLWRSTKDSPAHVPPLFPLAPDSHSLGLPQPIRDGPEGDEKRNIKEEI